MTEIRNLTRNGETFYPQTHIEGVLDPDGNYIGHYEENPEYIEALTDSENKILEGIKSDGTKHISGNLEIGGNIDTTMSTINFIDNPEYLSVELDSQGKILSGTRKDGSHYLYNIQSESISLINDSINSIDENKIDKEDGKSLINSDFANNINYEENPEYISIELDSGNKILESTKLDGTKVLPAGIEVGGNRILSISDPENRLKIETDIVGKIISYRKEDGTIVENVGIETNKLTLSSSGMSDFQKALKNSGFNPGGVGDWSDYISNDGENPLHINTPKCAMLNLITDYNLINLSKSGMAGAIEGVNYNIPIELEFSDGCGNYFKKQALLSGQGKSSMADQKKNIAIDLFDDSVYDSKGKLGKGDALKVKFGDWVPMDSYHLKAYWSDSLRCLGVIGYKLFDQMSKTRGVTNDYVWKRALVGNDVSWDGIGDQTTDNILLQTDTGAKCFPDGFPVIVYQNGSFWGVFSWQIKKDRDNYYLSKKKAKNIHLDGMIYQDLLMADGDIDWDVFNGFKPTVLGVNEQIEIRNPKDLYIQDGTKYDADYNVGELISPTMIVDGQEVDNPNYNPENTDHVKSYQVKQYIINLSKILPAIQRAQSTEVKGLMETYYDIDNLIDYLIFSDVIFNVDGWTFNWQWTTYDGVKWFVNVYDLDRSFGRAYDNIVHDGSADDPVYTNKPHCQMSMWGPYLISYYTSELEARWAALRKAGVIDADNITNILSDWLNAIGHDNLEKELDKWNINTTFYADSPMRVNLWLKRKIGLLDSVYHYTQN